ncbi:hypothetical protein Tco_1032521 [Tanacetum coccineum]|uniref:Uncharacterized protein n=1 Tax=Tanacetum coccineum TaxID=301880 RepID=A0ABQ5GC24_9ASTR
MDECGEIKGRSLGDIPCEKYDSWMWRTLLELVDRVRPHVRHVIGNGQTNLMWHSDDRPMGWYNMFPAFDNIPVPALKNSQPDKVKWICTNVRLVDFSIKQRQAANTRLDVGVE